MESQASVHLFLPKSAVKLYSFSVERNDACPTAITSFHKTSCFRKWFLFSLKLDHAKQWFSFLEWCWSYLGLFFIFSFHWLIITFTADFKLLIRWDRWNSSFIDLAVDNPTYDRHDYKCESKSLIAVFNLNSNLSLHLSVQDWNSIQVRYVINADDNASWLLSFAFYLFILISLQSLEE